MISSIRSKSEVVDIKTRRMSSEDKAETPPSRGELETPPLHYQKNYQFGRKSFAPKYKKILGLPSSSLGNHRASSAVPRAMISLSVSENGEKGLDPASMALIHFKKLLETSVFRPKKKGEKMYRNIYDRGYYEEPHVYGKPIDLREVSFNIIFLY
jgi:hypothetical protein